MSGRPKKFWRIGLTGSIATGKSTVLKAFATQGAKVFSADEAVHALYAGPAVAAVTALFAGIAPNGRIDRGLLSAELAKAPQRLAELEAVVHPMVRREIAAFMDGAAADNALIVVVEVPLLFESGFDYGFDAVGVTVCDPEEQKRRALERHGMTVEKLNAILARQLPQAEKKSRATYLFDTSGSKAQTEAMVKALVAAIQAREARHHQ